MSRRSNPIALAMLNYVQAVDQTFGLPEWQKVSFDYPFPAMSDPNAKVGA